MYAYIHVYIYIYVYSRYVYMYTCIYIYIYIYVWQDDDHQGHEDSLRASVSARPTIILCIHAIILVYYYMYNIMNDANL